MDSLLATYASSDDEEEKLPKPYSPPLPKPTSLFSTIPPPKTTPTSTSTSTSSSLFSTLHLPKSKPPHSTPSYSPPSSLFSSLPPPQTSSSPSSLFSALPLPKSNPKKVVQVKLPLHPSLLRPPIDDEDDEKPSKPAKESRSGPPSKKFYLPPPKHSLCLAPPPSSDPLRRTAAVSVEADAPPPATDLAAAAETADYGGVYANYEGCGGGWDAATEPPGVSDWVPTVEAGYGYGGYEGGVSGAVEAEVAEPEMPENLKRLGKRGRGGISVSETVVVRQADLMKDRPREDQLKATGIAFGPAYQPVSSAKGKPSKLHKRKHQIGSLYFDMKQKEMELEDRRSKGFLTKAETQAKYGW